jgi:hypothetical protein
MCESSHWLCNSLYHCHRCNGAETATNWGGNGPEVQFSASVSVSLVISPVITVVLAGGWFTASVKLDAVGTFTIETGSSVCAERRALETNSFTSGRHLLQGEAMPIDRSVPQPGDLQKNKVSEISFDMPVLSGGKSGGGKGRRTVDPGVQLVTVDGPVPSSGMAFGLPTSSSLPSASISVGEQGYVTNIIYGHDKVIYMDSNNKTVDSYNGVRARPKSSAANTLRARKQPFSAGTNENQDLRAYNVHLSIDIDASAHIWASIDLYAGWWDYWGFSIYRGSTSVLTLFDSLGDLGFDAPLSLYSSCYSLSDVTSGKVANTARRPVKNTEGTTLNLGTAVSLYVYSDALNYNDCVLEITSSSIISST